MTRSIFKIIAIVSCIAITTSANAQFDVSTSIYDISSFAKDDHVYWKLYPGYKADNGDYVVKFGSATHQMYKEKGSVVLTSIDHTFEELHFDKDLKYSSVEEKKFSVAPLNGVANNELLSYAKPFGKFLRINNHGYGNASVGSAIVGNPYPLTLDQLNKTVILYQGQLNPKIFPVNFSAVGGIFNANDDISKQTSYVTVWGMGEGTELQHEGKEKWSYGKNFIEKDGSGVFLFFNFDKDPEEYIFRVDRYEGSATPKVSKKFGFKYGVYVQLQQIIKQDGGYDYALIIQAPKPKYVLKKFENKDADFVEIIVLDGKTLEEKQRTTGNLQFTRWLPRYGGYTPEGNIVIFGAAGKDNKDQFPYGGAGSAWENKAQAAAGALNFADESPNFQTISLKDGKLTTNGISAISAQSITSVLNGSPYKLGKKQPIFTALWNNLQNTLPIYAFQEHTNGSWPWGTPNTIVGQENLFVHYVNGKVVVTFEAFVENSTYTTKVYNKDVTFYKSVRNGWATMILDANGKLEKYFYMPTGGFATSDQLFSADKKTLYWAVYEPNSLNKESGNSPLKGCLESEATPGLVSAELLLAKIDLTNNSASNVQVIGGKDNGYAISAAFPIIADTDSEIVFQGQVIGKKEENKLVLVKVKK